MMPRKMLTMRRQSVSRRRRTRRPVVRLFFSSCGEWASGIRLRASRESFTGVPAAVHGCVCLDCFERGEAESADYLDCAVIHQ